jgi:hypothetical protein
MEIKFIDNANQVVQREISKSEFVAVYKSTCENAERGFITVFSTTMQSLVTKLGLLISEVVIGPKILNHTYIGSINYLGLKILKNPVLLKHLQVTDINENANKVKHTLSSNSPIDIQDSIHQYNRLIQELINKCNLPSLSSIKIENKKSSIFEEKKSVKYEALADHRLEILLAPFYEYDAFEKLAKVPFTVKWQKPSNDIISVELKSQISNRIITSKVMAMVGNSMRLVLNLKKEDVVNDRVKLIATIKIIRVIKVSKTRTRYYETGFIFKKTVSYEEPYTEDEEQVISEKIIKIENSLRVNQVP